MSVLPLLSLCMSMPASNTMNEVDYLIIGQGLAGSLLATELIARKKSLLIVDSDHAHSSSMAAAGLINPVTGKRLHKETDVDTCLTTALNSYRELEQQFKQPFYHSVQMLRLFVDDDQSDYYQKRLNDESYQAYLGERLSEDQSLGLVKHSNGGFYQLQTGYLDIQQLLKQLTEHFERQKCLASEQLDYADLDIHSCWVQWKQTRAQKVIFCEGYQSVNNPWFKWLPFQLSKGEILTLTSEQVLTENIINKGHWLIPRADNQYKTGATNQWDFDDDQITAEGLKKNTDNFEQLFSQKPEYQVIQHDAGIRPATRDKKPFVGQHPDHPNLVMFNGFGARGSLTIPYYAKALSDHLCNGTSLPPSADISRFYDGQPD